MPTESMIKQSAFRMPASFWERAEALIGYLAQKRGLASAATVTRTDVLREALARGLRDLERERMQEEGK